MGKSSSIVFHPPEYLSQETQESCSKLVEQLKTLIQKTTNRSLLAKAFYSQGTYQQKLGHYQESIQSFSQSSNNRDEPDPLCLAARGESLRFIRKFDESKVDVLAA